MSKIKHLMNEYDIAKNVGGWGICIARVFLFFCINPNQYRPHLRDSQIQAMSLHAIFLKTKHLSSLIFAHFYLKSSLDFIKQQHNGTRQSWCIYRLDTGNSP